MNVNLAAIIRAVVPQVTDWTVLPLTGALTGASARHTPACRLDGNIVELCGVITGTITTGLIVANLTATYTPGVAEEFVVPLNTVTPGKLVITSDGALTVTVPATASTVGLGGLRFRLG